MKYNLPYIDKFSETCLIPLKTYLKVENDWRDNIKVLCQL